MEVKVICEDCIHNEVCSLKEYYRIFHYPDEAIRDCDKFLERRMNDE